MSREQLVSDLTLVLLYLNSWVEDELTLPSGEEREIRRSWKGADWDALDALRDGDLVNCTNKAKSVYLTRAGVERAEQLIDELGFRSSLEEENGNVDGELKSASEDASVATPVIVPAFTFRLTFVFYELKCWRELRVPKTFTFEDFHTAIQACLSWLNYHLYDFKFTSKGAKHQVSWPSFETGGNPLLDFLFLDEDERSLPQWTDAADLRLDEVFPRTRKALYSYDYGDGWEIEVRLVDSKTPLSDGNPLCVGGAGDNPPEDVGAEWGFAEFLRVIADPDDPEHDHLVAWGESQTFEHFDLNSTNDRLARYNEWRVKDVY